MTIVCGIDFTEASRDAARVAAAIARHRDETLLLVHSAPTDATNQDALRAVLEAEAVALRDPALLVRAELRNGWPDENLEDIAEANAATLIVVGAIGHRAGTHWITGSVPERLAQRTRRPLLVVRDANSLDAWLRGETTLTCIAGTDLTPSSRRVLDETNALATLGRVSTVLAYVVYQPGEYARLGISGPIYHARMHPVVEAVVNRGLREEARVLGKCQPVITKSPLTLGRAAEPLFFASDEQHAQLIVVGAHQRHGFARLWHGSVAHNVLHGASTNVLVVPVHSAPGDAATLRPPDVDAILAATDFSAGGDRALAWARAIAPPDARLLLLTVIDDETKRTAANRQLHERAEAMHGHLTCEVVTSNDVAAAIAAAGERFGARAICVGASGAGGTAHPLLGSVARELLTRARVPLLAVREA